MKGSSRIKAARHLEIPGRSDRVSSLTRPEWRTREAGYSHPNTNTERPRHSARYGGTYEWGTGAPGWPRRVNLKWFRG